ncbi:hypothetical protein C8R47DRAFT_1079759 [Mycena vitilis]|nr:hypothetical protein C8R47DRAFT_1079759 [Mycena vitilis]
MSRRAAGTPGPQTTKPRAAAAQVPVKREGASSASAAGSAQVLADLKRYCSPVRSPPPSPRKPDQGDFVNFAIRGGGIVSSSAGRSQQRYLELQRQGEEPDMLVTRSVEQAALFALEDSDYEYAMTRIGAAAKKRQREGLPPVKPGLPSWVHGTKETFFAAMKDDFRAAKEVGRMGSFYDEAAHKYLGIYGYHTGWLEDLEEGQTVADDVDPDEDPNSVDPDEAAERAVYFKKLRGKIGVWFNGRYGAVEKKTKKVTFREVFDKPELDPPAPVKARTINFYSRRYYHERVAPTVTARWEAAKRLPNPPKLVTLRGAVTRELYAGESPAFKAEMQSSIEREHKAATDAYAMAMAADVPTTAEQFDVALNNAPYYLQPFADAIQAQYGMNVCIMMCGPVPDRGGRIEVRRYENYEN